MDDNKKISYKNTLVYTIIAAIISLGLLVLLAFQAFMDYIYLIAIIETGIFAIIGYCIYKIIKFEKSLDSLRDQRKYYIPFSECPDYFVKKFDNESGEPYCSNEYRVTDVNNNVNMMKIYPSTVALPTKHDDTTSVTLSQKYEKLWLNKISNSKELVTLKDKCSVLSVEPTNQKLIDYKGYTNVPWTSVRGRCEGFF
jgi:hypothetical protein